jgi:hypothetical protein
LEKTSFCSSIIMLSMILNTIKDSKMNLQDLNGKLKTEKHRRSRNLQNKV